MLGSHTCFTVDRDVVQPWGRGNASSYELSADDMSDLNDHNKTGMLKIYLKGRKEDAAGKRV